MKNRSFFAQLGALPLRDKSNHLDASQIYKSSKDWVRAPLTVVFPGKIIYLLYTVPTGKLT